MKRILLLCLAAGLLLFSGCQQEKEDLPAISGAEKPVSILIASDLHYLAPSLTDGGQIFRQVLEAGDGKITEYAEEITDAFIEEVIAEKPDILILSGDLTLNGEAESHTALIKKLETITAAGIQVLVIPGNHDLNNPNAVRFSSNTCEPQPSMTSAEFRIAYKNFEYEQAIANDRNSLSYVYAACSDLWIFMVDTNSQVENTVTDQTIQWLEKQLKKAKKQNARIIAVSHQTILTHNQIFSAGYQIDNAEELLMLYQEYDVSANFSGHLHLQHILTDPESAMTEIVTSALAVSPNQYGKIQYDGNALSYQTQRLHVSEWAETHSVENQDLLHFADYARKRMEQTAYRQITDFLSRSDLTQKEKELLAGTFVALNTAYFAGDTIDKAPLRPGLKLWEAQPVPFYSAYIQSILADNPTDHHHLFLR